MSGIQAQSIGEKFFIFISLHCLSTRARTCFIVNRVVVEHVQYYRIRFGRIHSPVCAEGWGLAQNWRCWYRPIIDRFCCRFLVWPCHSRIAVTHRYCRPIPFRCSDHRITRSTNTLNCARRSSGRSIRTGCAALYDARITCTCRDRCLRICHGDIADSATEQQ